MGKINYVCEFGVVHSTANCRCMSIHVDTRHVKCDVPDEHNPLDPEDPHNMKQFLLEVKQGESMITSLHDRLQETVDSTFGTMIAPIVKNALVTELERGVVAWLIESAQFVLNQNKE